MMLRNRPIRNLKLLVLCACVVAVGALPASERTSLVVRASASPQPASPMMQDTQSAQSSPCQGVLADHDTLKKTLLRVPKYQKTYVVVVGGRAKDTVTAPVSPGLAELSVEINDEPGAVAIARDLHLSTVRTIPATQQSPVQALVDLAAGKTDAVVLWGPLAGAGIMDLALEDKIAVFSVDGPKDSPSQYAGHSDTEADPCAAAISDDLDSFGVLPGELLVPVNMRSMLGTPTPVFSMQNARLGGQPFAQNCARCHGQDAVWDPALAPVDLLKSIRRFQFIGFKYIVMNGRQQKGMPPLRGTVSEDQIALIFQYLQARSKNELAASSK